MASRPRSSRRGRRGVRGRRRDRQLARGDRGDLWRGPGGCEGWEEGRVAGCGGPGDLPRRPLSL
ncbi:unnamed protein product [Spirodela intermedia]|uniref:Uncharacterized protein n=1 Tax=Spirodela intermedia TaxID=51605 RepID=A0A7I8JBQ4_SPIIN|nr:unnamed protein product [Spirodela intermedia]CAA6667636.1 unnamed protein product [Spirodela intermedia]